MPPRMTKTERIARRRAGYYLWLEQEDHFWLEDIRRDIPREWHTIEADLDCEEPRDKVTLYLDRSVARAFRAMGKGYQARINRILCTWLQLKLGGLYNEAEALRARAGQVAREETAKYGDGPSPGWDSLVESWDEKYGGTELIEEY